MENWKVAAWLIIILLPVRHCTQRWNKAQSFSIFQWLTRCVQFIPEPVASRHHTAFVIYVHIQVCLPVCLCACVLVCLCVCVRALDELFRFMHLTSMRHLAITSSTHLSGNSASSSRQPVQQTSIFAPCCVVLCSAVLCCIFQPVMDNVSCQHRVVVAVVVLHRKYNLKFNRWTSAVELCTPLNGHDKNMCKWPKAIQTLSTLAWIRYYEGEKCFKKKQKTSQ